MPNSGPPSGFTRVSATPEEIESWRDAEARRRLSPRSSYRHLSDEQYQAAVTNTRFQLARQFPGIYRVQCQSCGERIWGSGLGVGSHRRHCKGAQS